MGLLMWNDCSSHYDIISMSFCELECMDLIIWNWSSRYVSMSFCELQCMGF